jgi:hypothetical protein
MFVLLIVEYMLEIVILILLNVILEFDLHYEIDRRDKHKRNQSMMDRILNQLNYIERKSYFI